ncbi:MULTISPECIES: hypothetical protein [Mesorhizobium]|uniref:hypothetical protein n=1 Tax=Mesorhizobium TaxID=68287 RepID=UPI001140A77F|nr:MULTISPECIES: hypothetical protein [Mesorhizobium]
MRAYPETLLCPKTDKNVARAIKDRHGRLPVRGQLLKGIRSGNRHATCSDNFVSGDVSSASWNSAVIGQRLGGVVIDPDAKYSEESLDALSFDAAGM